MGLRPRRGAERLGVPLAACRLVIVGDTPKDVAAAHANGGACLAVATGGASFEALVEAGAEIVCDDLTDPKAQAWLLGMAGDGMGEAPRALGGSRGDS